MLLEALKGAVLGPQLEVYLTAGAERVHCHGCGEWEPLRARTVDDATNELMMVSLAHMYCQLRWMADGGELSR